MVVGGVPIGCVSLRHAGVNDKHNKYDNRNVCYSHTNSIFKCVLYLLHNTCTRAY